MATLSLRTTSRQREVRAPLGELAASVAAVGLGSPVIFVIGPVVDALREGGAEATGAALAERAVYA